MNPTSILHQQETYRLKLIERIEKGVAQLVLQNIQCDDLVLAKQALQFLKQNRVSRVDTSHHLNVLLNCDAFQASEIGENAKLMLKFVRMSERMNMEAEKLRQSKEMPPRVKKGGVNSQLSSYYGTMLSGFGEDQTMSRVISPTSSAQHISQIYNIDVNENSRRNMGNRT